MNAVVRKKEPFLKRVMKNPPAALWFFRMKFHKKVNARKLRRLVETAENDEKFANRMFCRFKEGEFMALDSVGAERAMKNSYEGAARKLTFAMQYVDGDAEMADLVEHRAMVKINEAEVFSRLGGLKWCEVEFEPVMAEEILREVKEDIAFSRWLRAGLENNDSAGIEERLLIFRMKAKAALPMTRHEEDALALLSPLRRTMWEPDKPSGGTKQGRAFFKASAP